ncbi:YibE/F family protein [Bacillus salitolerans]|uniref:YibE/F family protein n=1 Tax=Bacillus salitolerans TaxID=1437434 RepID=A0ABW4LV06_9BACI
MFDFFKKCTKKHLLYYSLTIVFVLSTIIFVNNNHSFYERPIAKVIHINLVDSIEIIDIHDNQDQLFTQHLIGILKNGEQEGQLIKLTNEYSASGANDHKYKRGHELFVSIDSNSFKESELTGTITDVKRDKHVLIIAWIFILTLLMVGKKQGLLSIISLVMNAFILSYALDTYIHTPNIPLLLICSISAILFTVLSLLLVNGFNEKTYAAVIATLLGTFTSLGITYLSLSLSSEMGLRYEGMQFLTRAPQVVFMAGVLVGSLGAVMDVAITMSSSIFGLYERDPNISVGALKKSGLDIGRDIMGTMTNILFFVYISGSIPMLILYLKNASPLGFTLSINLTLELARALAGGIGIVLTIPIGLFTAIYFINQKRER